MSKSTLGSRYAYRPRPVTRDGKHFRRKIVRKSDTRNKEQSVISCDQGNDSEDEILKACVCSDEDSFSDDNSEMLSPTPLGHQDSGQFPDEKDSQVRIYKAVCQRLSVVPVEHFMKQVNTKEVSLNYHQLSAQGTKPIAIILVDNVTVTSLSLTGCGIGDDGADYILDMLQENRYITCLSIGQNNLGTASAVKLHDVLCNNKMIVSLDVSNNNFKDTDGTFFAKLIEHNEVIRELNLSHNSFGELTGKVLVDAFDKNSTLRRLDLSWNHFRKKGAIDLIHGLKTNIGLTYINMAWNGLSVEGCKAMGEVLVQNSSITDLDLTANRVNLVGFRYLTLGILQNSTLRSLKIGNNPITSEGATEILRAIGMSEDSAVEELDLTNISVGGEFEDILGEIRQTRDLTVRHGNTLRHESHIINVEVKKLEETDDPCFFLFKYMKQENMRITDLFNFLDRKKKGFLLREDFAIGFKNMNIPISSKSIAILMKQLDEDGDGEIELQEFYKISRYYNRKVRQVALQQQQQKEREEKEAKTSKILSAFSALKDVQSGDRGTPTLPSVVETRKLSMRGLMRNLLDARRSSMNGSTSVRAQLLPSDEKSASSANSQKEKSDSVAEQSKGDPLYPQRFLPSIH